MTEILVAGFLPNWDSVSLARLRCDTVLSFLWWPGQQEQECEQVCCIACIADVRPAAAARHGRHQEEDAVDEGESPD